MPYVRSKADRGKAAALVLALHVVLGLVLVSGLAADTAQRASDSLKSFDVVTPPPPEPEQAIPSPERSAPREEAAPPNLRAEPSPIVLPPAAAPLPAPSPLPTSDERSPLEGSDRTAGAAEIAGPGTGTGGAGDGFGGGGAGGSGAGGGLGTNARLLSGNLTRADYRRIRSFGSPRGRAVLALTVEPSGRVLECVPVASSGNPPLDEELCRLLARTRWSPALDRRGEPVAATLRYVATWDRD